MKFFDMFDLVTGLGLIICNEFIELNGGSLLIESKEGKGSTISIILPRKL